MKTYNYPHGKPAKTVLTVGELIERLSQHPADMPVVAEWEDQRMPLGFIMNVEQSYFDGEGDWLVVNAEYGDGA